MHFVWRLHAQGLRAQLVRRTETSQHKVVLRIGLPELEFRRRYHDEVVAQWKKSGNGLNLNGGGTEASASVSDAERVLMIARILESETDGCGFGHVEHITSRKDHDERVRYIFPLHDRAFAQELREIVSPANFWLRCRGCTRKRAKDAVSAAHDAQNVLEVSVGSGIEYIGSAVSGKRASAAHAEEQSPARGFQPVKAVNKAVTHFDNALQSSGKRVGKCTHGVVQAMGDLTRADSQIVERIAAQYGERVAFYFAFQYTFLNSLTLVIVMVLVMVAASFRFKHYSTFLQISGLLGLLIPCVWGPLFLGAWAHVSSGLVAQWQNLGLVQQDVPSPNYNPKRTCLATMLIVLIGVSGTALAVSSVFVLSILVMEMEVMIASTPLCGSWFYEHVWRDFATHGGAYRNETKRALLSHVVTGVLPSCYTS